MQFSTFFTVLSAFVSLSFTSDAPPSTPNEEALILASKSMMNNYLVQGKEMAFRYSLYNVGGSSALEVTLKDDSFPKEVFTVIRGQVEMKWSRIPAGSNVTHVVVVTANIPGYFNFTAAAVSYKSTEDGELQLGSTSYPGEGGIIPLDQYERKFSSHSFDWLGFVILTLPSVAIPFMLWYQQRAKYSKDSKSN